VIYLPFSYPEASPPSDNSSLKIFKRKQKRSRRGGVEKKKKTGWWARVTRDY
jgi:hypothetical protein